MEYESINPKRWYAVKEVASLLAVHTDTVRRAVYGGYLRAFIYPKSRRRRRPRRLVRILGKWLVEFIDKNTYGNQ